MDTLVKLLKWLLISALVLGAIFLLVIFNFETLERAYERWTFEHDAVIEDVYVGMPKADILFKFGEPDKEWDDGDVAYGSTSTLPLRVFFLTDNKLTHWVISEDNFDGPRSTEKLMEVAGQPFLETHSDETNTRGYTYITGNQEGVTYSYKANKLEDLDLGQVHWRAFGNVSFYAVKGTQVCPGNMCPYDLEQEDTPMKDEWKDKTVWDLIDKYDL
jgi:hypothetical protein